MELLKGHHSQETAHIIDDYPYGFRLRCKRRVWLESDKKGIKWRFVSQTTNPKRGDTWNKPKKSTYAFLAAAMYLDDDGHVQWTGHSEYTDADESQAFLDTYREALTSDMVKLMEHWIRRKRDFEAKLASGEVKITIRSSGPERVL